MLVALLLADAAGDVSPAVGRSGTFDDRTGVAVPRSVAVPAWTAAALEVLLALARRYGSWIAYEDLAGTLQSATGIRTTQQTRHWIGKVLEGVDRAQPPGPALTSFVLRKDQTIGEGYAGTLRRRGVPVPEDLELHAAEERLACHRHFGAAMPPDGGRPTLPPAEVRRRQERRGTASTPPQLCPDCFTELSRSGTCGVCS